ncbi:UvrD-helicase domain-containing protein, partial [Variovorax sp. RHLX14]
MNNIHAAVMGFTAATFKDGATVREVLSPVLEQRLFDADSRLVQAYEDTSPPPPEPKIKGKEAKEDRLKRGWHALFSVPWQEIARYRAYLAGE